MSTAMPVLIDRAAPTRGRRAGAGSGRPACRACCPPAVIAIAMIAAIFGPLLAPYDPNLPNLSLSFVGPTAGHLLGYDYQGRTCSRGCWPARGRRCSVRLVVVVRSASCSARCSRSVAAWRRARSTRDLAPCSTSCSPSRASCWRSSSTAVFGPGLTAAALALSVAYMPYVARVLRGAALRERSQPYVAALEVQGASAPSICLRTS